MRPTARLLKAEAKALDRTVCCFLHSYSYVAIKFNLIIEGALNLQVLSVVRGGSKKFKISLTINVDCRKCENTDGQREMIKITSNSITHR